jgi:diphosphomevalonate decarboxylase
MSSVYHHEASSDVQKTDSNVWIAHAPSNIALVKYMGKVDSANNKALNSSLSYTLDYLQSEVSVQLLNESRAGSEIGDSWQVWDANSIQLTANGKEKFLKHWQRCRQALAPSYKGSFVLSSRNHFPSDCGLASSASSFAALTLAAYKSFSSLKVLEKDWNLNELANLSRAGSGSSCRSFFSPFVLWQGETVMPVDSAYQKLWHTVIVVDSNIKKVSSSEAHKRVPTSLLYQGRLDRAELRTQQLLQALKNKDWRKIFEVSWADFWDMHVLFETSVPPFSYMLPESLELIRNVQNLWDSQGDGPVITMDAGANIHLLYRDEQKDLALKQKQEFANRFKVYSNL